MIPADLTPFLYDAAPWCFLLFLIICIWCLYRGHRAKSINLWEVVTTSDRYGNNRTDALKLFQAGAFSVMTAGFAYQLMTFRLDQVYVGVYVGVIFGARAFGLREKRLNRAIALEHDYKDPAAEAALARKVAEEATTDPDNTLRERDRGKG